MSCFAVFAQSG